MSERAALILGSAIAAACLAAPLVWLLAEIDWRLGSLRVHAMQQARLTLPAIFAALISAWMHTRGQSAKDCPNGTLASRIVIGAFAVFAGLISLVFSVETLTDIEPNTRVGFALIGVLAAAFLSGVVGGFLFYIPAFCLEYVVIRFVRAPQVRTVLSGADS